MIFRTVTVCIRLMYYSARTERAQLKSIHAAVAEGISIKTRYNLPVGRFVYDIFLLLLLWLLLVQQTQQAIQTSHTHALSYLLPIALNWLLAHLLGALLKMRSRPISANTAMHYDFMWSESKSLRRRGNCHRLRHDASRVLASRQCALSSLQFFDCERYPCSKFQAGTTER